MKSKKATKKNPMSGIRGDWNGVKPITRIIPDKKKPRKNSARKHKGRPWTAFVVFFCS
jgi:hypothetical protein